MAPELPQIVTALPGPKTKALIADDERYISSSYTRGYPLAIEEAAGLMVKDPDGNWFLDFCAGIAVNSSRHCHPKVVQAITKQASQFLHMSGTDFYYQVMVDLAKKLDETSGIGEPCSVFFANSGTEANEGAIKLARYHTQRQGIISFFSSFHGRTFGSMSVTASKSIQKHHFGPLLAGVYHGHYPNAYRKFFKFHGTPEDEAQACLDYIENYIFKMLVKPDDVAAIMLEAIQGEGGYNVPPKNWLPGIRELCDKYGMLMICDEVQAGMGRTGKIWAFEHDGVAPDIVTSAKGIASGLPLGAIIAKKRVMNWTPGTHATTFGGNPVACAAALATFNVIEEEGLLANATTQGERLMQGLQALVDEFDCLGQVRGRGLMVGLEVITDKKSKGKNAPLRDAIVDKCYEHGLLILGCGENTIRFSPPLVLTAQHVDCALGILKTVIAGLLP